MADDPTSSECYARQRGATKTYRISSSLGGQGIPHRRLPVARNRRRDRKLLKPARSAGRDRRERGREPSSPQEPSAAGRTAAAHFALSGLLLEGAEELHKQVAELKRAGKRQAAPKTRNSREKEIDGFYYLNIEEAVNSKADVKSAIIGVPADRISQDALRRCGQTSVEISIPTYQAPRRNSRITPSR